MNDTLTHLYSLTDDVESLTYLFEFIEEAFYNREPMIVNELLGSFDPSKCKVIISTGLLRCSCRAKDLLPNWSICLMKTKQHLESLDLNADRLLRGLL